MTRPPGTRAFGDPRGDLEYCCGQAKLYQSGATSPSPRSGVFRLLGLTPNTGPLCLPRAQPCDGPAQAVSQSRRLRRLPGGAGRGAGRAPLRVLRYCIMPHALPCRVLVRRRWGTDFICALVGVELDAVGPQGLAGGLGRITRINWLVRSRSRATASWTRWANPTGSAGSCVQEMTPW